MLRAAKEVARLHQHEGEEQCIDQRDDRPRFDCAEADTRRAGSWCVLSPASRCGQVRRCKPGKNDGERDV
jgi:hypothetical protein